MQFLPKRFEPAALMKPQVPDKRNYKHLVFLRFRKRSHRPGSTWINNAISNVPFLLERRHPLVIFKIEFDALGLLLTADFVAHHDDG